MLIGVVALMFLGPRKMPEMARKMGKFMSDFRNTTNEFKSTWEREVNFEEEQQMIRSGDVAPVYPPTPAIREASPEMMRSAGMTGAAVAAASTTDRVSSEAGSTHDLEPLQETAEKDTLSDKRNWL